MKKMGLVFLFFILGACAPGNEARHNNPAGGGGGGRPPNKPVEGKPSTELELKDIAFTLTIRTDEGTDKDHVLCVVQTQDRHFKDRVVPVKLTGSDKIECEGVAVTEVYNADKSILLGYSASIVRNAAHRYAVRIIRDKKVVPVEIELPLEDVENFKLDTVDGMSTQSTLVGYWNQTQSPEDVRKKIYRQVEVYGPSSGYFDSIALEATQTRFELKPPKAGWPKEMKIRFVLFQSKFLPEKLAGSSNGQRAKTITTKIQ